MTPPSARGGRSSPRCGFTLVELIIVMVIIAVLGAAVVPSLVRAPAIDPAAFASPLTGVLRAAQRMAVDSGRVVRVSIDPASGRDRESLRLELEKANIESRPLWKPMHLQPIFEKYPYYGGTVCENLFTDGLCLPSGSNLGESDIRRIEDVLNQFFTYK